VHVHAKYNKQFGWPLYLEKYNASKLVNLNEKMIFIYLFIYIRDEDGLNNFSFGKAFITFFLEVQY
jgi:hypothetical protein